MLWMTLPSYDRVAQLLTYDPLTGLFAYKVPRPGPGPKPGAPYAGSQGGRGHRQIRIDGQPYYAHRLAWLLHYGAWPVLSIDHIDGNPSNNKIANLREASQDLNVRNQCRRSDNSSGFKGVAWHKQARKWRAYISVNGRQFSLGLHDTAKAAAETRRKKGELFHGEFFRGK